MYQALQRSPARRLLPEPLVNRVRKRLLRMREADVIRVLDALDEAAAEPVLAGGWGVDALVGRQTRRHFDLDVVIAPGTEAESRARAALAPLGYEVVDPHALAGHWTEARAVLRDADGHTIDLLQVGVGDGTAEGHLAGRAVRCLSPETQLLFHQGYPLPSKHRRDIDLLCRTFHLPRPADGHPS